MHLKSIYKLDDGRKMYLTPEMRPVFITSDGQMNDVDQGYYKSGDTEIIVQYSSGRITTTFFAEDFARSITYLPHAKQP